MGRVPVDLNVDIRTKMSGNRSANAKEGPPQEEGELIKVAKVVKSNTFSNKGSFRQTDDMYLQTKAKIWLAEVLRVIFKEEALVADLLANGELLFNLAMVLRKKVAKLPTGSTNLRKKIEKIPSGRANERYMAYPKIDSFLTICKVIGLKSIDLFSPSDVVEKRNTRGVCLCLRTLSKKARLKDLDVPDFDTVTYTTPGSKDMVRFACRNLKLSQIGRQNSDPIGIRAPPVRQHSAVDGDGYLQDIERGQKNFPFEMDGSSSDSGSSDGSGSLSPSRTGSAKTVDDLDDMRLLLEVSHFLDQSYLNDLHFSEDDNTKKGHKKQDDHLSSKTPMLPEDGLLRCCGDVKQQAMFESSTWDSLCDDRSKQSSVGSLEEDFPPEHVDEDVVRCGPVEAEMKVEEEKTEDPRDKRPKNTFLKTIGNGVLLAGGLFFALQFSGGNGGGNGFDAAIKRPREVEETNKGSAPRKAEVGKAGGIYSSRDWFRF